MTTTWLMRRARVDDHVGELANLVALTANTCSKVELHREPTVPRFSAVYVAWMG